MYTFDEVKRKMFIIKKELLTIIKENEHKALDNKEYNLVKREIYRLYTEYLKLYVQVSRKIPEYVGKDFSNQFNRYNCYFYALDFNIPPIFVDAMTTVGRCMFSSSIGIISSQSSLWNINRTSLIDTFYADMDTLNINVYNSDNNSSNMHDGYKVGIYIDDFGISNDYHFVRENSNGLFSHKIGYVSRPEYLPNLSDFIHNDFHYELIKTVEIVKPTIKR